MVLMASHPVQQKRIDRELVAARTEAQKLANSLVPPDDRHPLRQEWISFRLVRYVLPLLRRVAVGITVD